jgi:hypothetical protein
MKGRMMILAVSALMNLALPEISLAQVDTSTGTAHSDIRLKEDIVPLGRVQDGINLYRFRYKGSDRTVYVGVLAQEVRSVVPSAVLQDAAGYLLVDYDRLGLKFMTWDQWLAQQHSGSLPPN